MRIIRALLASLLALLFSAVAFGQSPAVEKTNEGIVVRIGDSFLKLEVCSAEVIRVAFARDRAFFTRQSLVASPRRCEPTQWNVTNSAREAILRTPKLKIKVDLTTGALGFFDQTDQPIVTEKQNGRTLTPVEVQGEKTFQVRQVWQANSDEALYGLGQHQFGLMDIKGYDLDLWQRNTVVAVPFLVSSHGYGILWDNTSWTRFGDLRDFEFIPSQNLFDASGRLGGLS